jgi:hypothetical protein
VVLGEVQRLEVVPVGLDLGALRDPVAQAEEDVDRLVDGAVDGVDLAARGDPARQGDVDALGLQQGGVPGRLQLGAAGGHCPLQGGTGLVDPLAEHTAAFGRQGAERPLDVAQRGASGEVLLLDLAQRLQVAGGGDRRPPGGHDGVQVRLGAVLAARVGGLVGHLVLLHRKKAILGEILA